MDVTCCVLCYGDHAALSTRCLESLLAALPDPALVELRLGLSGCSDANAKAILDRAGRFLAAGVAVACYYPEPDQRPKPDGTPVYPKYPVQRVLLGREHRVPLRAPSAAVTPITTDAVVWFDDDSYLRAPAPGEFFTGLGEHLRHADILGEPWYGRPTPERWAFYRDPASCAWADPAIAVPLDGRLYFPTGGWWAARAEVLQRWDWPPPRLRHRGGDSLMGDLIRQAPLRWSKGSFGVAINADALGRRSKQPTRGFWEPPLGDSGPGDDRWSYG